MRSIRLDHVASLSKIVSYFLDMTLSREKLKRMSSLNCLSLHSKNYAILDAI